MKKRRTEEDGDPSSMKPLSKLKKQKLNASESKAINPEPKAQKDDTMTKNKKEKVKHAERRMEEEKNSYLPGQRHGTPHERDPFRIFLETLHERIPDNELAESWMIEWGLLFSDKKAKEACEVIMLDEKDQHGQLESANGDAADARTSTLSKAKKQKVRRTGSDDAISVLNSKKKKMKSKTEGLH